MDVRVAHAAAGSKDVVLAFHSSGAGARQWDLGSRLLPSAHWLAPNCMGYGGSTPWPRGGAAPPPTIWDQAAVIGPSLLERLRPILGPGGKVSVLAHSYGASVALATLPALLAADYRISSLVLYEPNCFVLLDAAGRAEMSGRVRSWLASRAAGDEEAFMTGFYDFWFGVGAWARLPAHQRPRVCASLRDIDLELCATMSKFQPLEGMPRILQPLPGEDVRGPWQRLLRAERLAACAKHTVLGALVPHPMITRLASSLHHDFGFEAHTVQVAGAGHMGPVTHADEVVGAMLALAT